MLDLTYTPQNWYDVTTIDGGVSKVTCGVSTCIYQDNVTGSYVKGLQVTGILSSTKNTTSTNNPWKATWSLAVSGCHDSIYGGYQINTWRLPTKDELVALYADGIAGLTGGNKTFLSPANTKLPFWSSTTTPTSNAYNVNIETGVTSNISQVNTFYVLCVR